MKRHNGFGAIAAIVVLVILATLAAAITSIGTAQQIGSAQDVMSAKAWQAARAGNEWDLYQTLRVPGTFAQVASTTITVSRTAHGYLAGDVLYLDFDTANDNLDGEYTVGGTVATDSFQVTSTISQTASGNVNFCITRRTLDLTADTGFSVTVTCDSRGYNEGESVPGTAQTIGIYSIRATACTSATCPDTSATVAGIGYVERSRVVVATNR